MPARLGARRLSAGGHRVPYVSNLTPANTARMRAAFQAMRAGTRNMVVVFMDDSTGRGVDETASPKNSQYGLSITEWLARAFRADGIPAGANNFYGISGTNLADYLERAGYLTVGGTAVLGSTIVQGGAGITMSSATATVTYTPPDNVDTAVISTMQFSGFNGGTLAVLVDDVAAGTIVQNATTTIRKTTFPLGSVGQHSIKINWSSGSNGLYAIECYDSTRKEISFRNWSISGGSSSMFIDNTGANQAGRINQMNLDPPDLVIAEGGIVNSARASVAIGTVVSQIEQLIDYVKAAGADFMFREPPFDTSGQGAAANLQQYSDQVAAATIARGCPVIRMRQALVSKAASDAAGYTVSNDAVHYLIGGQAFGARIVKPILRAGMGI